MYCNINHRLLTGSVVHQFWSKARFIGDASKGSLNSFGYTLLVLYFLQHCSPPVIPNAQAMASSDEVAQATKNSPNPFLSSPFTSWRTDNTDSIGMFVLSTLALGLNTSTLHRWAVVLVLQVLQHRVQPDSPSNLYQHWRSAYTA